MLHTDKNDVQESEEIVPAIKSVKVSGTSTAARLTDSGVCTECSSNTDRFRHDPRYIETCSKYEEHWYHVQHSVPERIICVEFLRPHPL